jgi:hypothetical protein
MYLDAQFEIFFKDIASAMPLQERVSAIEEAHKEGIRGIWCKKNLNL